MTSAVLDEAIKKAALAWVSVGEGPALGLWCMPLDGSLIVVTGPGEQLAPKGLGSSAPSEGPGAGHSTAPKGLGSSAPSEGPGAGHSTAAELADAARATVRLRGDHGGLIVISEMAVERIRPGTEEWATVAPQLAAKRLNASGSADEVVARWAETGCAVVRLSPDQEEPITTPDMPAVSGAEPPRETPARVQVRRPFRLHRVRRR